MQKKRPYVVSIAGLDPSGGAGLFADIKTFESNKVHGFGVSTATTYQTDDEFIGLKWETAESIQAQLTPILSKYAVSHVKIGLIESANTLITIINVIKSFNKDIFIVWDPILSASSGFNFHDKKKHSALLKGVEQVDMITPNLVEYRLLFNDLKPEEFFNTFQTILFLKGGHRTDKKGQDYIYHKSGTYPLRAQKEAVTAKHGSGCVLSSALISNLAKGYDLHKSSLRAKDYTFKVLKSNNSLLAYHKI